jgi:hypothetical protein
MLTLVGSLSTGRARRTLAAIGLTLAVAAGSVALAPSVSADPDIPIDQNVDVTTHLATLNQDIVTTGGSLTGTLDLGTGDLTGDLTLPATETWLQLASLPLAAVGTRVVPTGPITGHVDLATSTITTTSSFHLLIDYVRPLGVKALNLVGNRCQTNRPITLDTTGTIDLATQAGTLQGEFEIPPLKNCGLSTLLLNSLVSGPGNTFTASVTPATAT